MLALLAGATSRRILNKSAIGVELHVAGAAELSTDVTNLPRQYRCSSREQQVLADDLFQRVYAICTPPEKRFLYYRYVKQLSGREIAQREGVSPQSISKRRRKVGQKALKIIAENTDN